MFSYRRPVSFSEVDSARLVFYPRFHDYCHDALEKFFEQLPGGYPHLFNERDIGIPTIHLTSDFSSPLRYGDVAIFELVVEHIGRTSVIVNHTIIRERDQIVCARVRHVFVTVRISTLKPIPVPDDMRALFERHKVAGGG